MKPATKHRNLPPPHARQDSGQRASTVQSRRFARLLCSSIAPLTLGFPAEAFALGEAETSEVNRATSKDARGDLLADIRNGVQLKPAQPRARSTPSSADAPSTETTIGTEMRKRRAAYESDPPSPVSPSASSRVDSVPTTPTVTQPSSHPEPSLVSPRHPSAPNSPGVASLLPVPPAESTRLPANALVAGGAETSEVNRATSNDARGDLLADIRNGVQLKKLAQPRARSTPSSDAGTLGDVLKRAIAEKMKVLGQQSPSPTSPSASSWVDSVPTTPTVTQLSSQPASPPVDPGHRTSPNSQSVVPRHPLPLAESTQPHPNRPTPALKPTWPLREDSVQSQTASSHVAPAATLQEHAQQSP
ncbi:WH2 domain-containing protein, partial [Burkholderia sp. DN3021]|uniref:WH2 domain-containing protein n=1 Tax=Burkholderia sp. DN3021 TaxID=3410137 RepID=UPI003C7B93DF